METGVISKQLEDKIGERKVVAAVLTTYVFEPHFFELEVIPLLLQNQHCTYVNDALVKRFLVRDALRKENIPIDVFYDAPMFSRNNSSDSPQMDYLCHGVDLRGSAFHPKLIFLLVEDSNSEQKLLIAAGSNNLTYAGWWDNIECQHWVEIGEHDTRLYDLTRFRACISYLNSKKDKSTNITEHNALSKIDSFLKACKGKNDAHLLHFYGPNDNSVNNKGFIDFLKNDMALLGSTDKWTVEIISPYFVTNADNELHNRFTNADNVKEVLLYLPRDAEGQALCDEGYYNHIQESENISWSNWTDDVVKMLGLKPGVIRTLHAKIYRFYNGNKCWIFVGSVNFTQKAVDSNRSEADNAEAGFLTWWKNKTPLLQRLPDNEQMLFVQDLDSEFPGSDDELAVSYPIIRLSFNWVNEKLSGYVEAEKETLINISGHEGEGVPLISAWRLTDTPKEYTGDLSALKKHLQNNSLVTVSAASAQSEKFYSHILLIQQTGWGHKSVEIDHLSADQIIAIYAGMSPEQRQMLLINAKIKYLLQHGVVGEGHVIQDEDIPKGFFCEYAEIFHAFRKLKNQLYAALADGNDNDVDYYLTGKGIDSIPSLLERSLQTGLIEEQQTLDGVTAYLIMLSCLEILQDEKFKIRVNVNDLITEIEKHIKAIKAGPRIKLGDQNPKVFYKWFEEYFYKEFKQVNPEILEGETV